MEIRYDFRLLWDQVRRVSEERESFEVSFDRNRLEPIEIELMEGKEISLDQIEFVNGLLSVEGRQVLLFIADHGSGVLAAQEDPEKGRRYHVAECATLAEMREKGRFQRYIATNKLSGVFTIFGTDQSRSQDISCDVALKVCINCLKRINYKDYRNARAARPLIWKPFDIAEFFNTFSTSFKHLPREIPGRAMSGSYTADWAALSMEIRREASFCCDECKVNLIGSPGLLHVHHINGVKNDNQRSNLRPLCADCHRKQPMHGGMFIRAQDMVLISRLRREQSLIPTGWEQAMKLADLSVHGALAEAKVRSMPCPEIGFEISGRDGKVIAEIEVAWPDSRIGIYVGAKPEAPGWNLMEPAEYLGLV